MANHPLRRWRKTAGLTAEQLGRAVGVTKWAVSGYERGRRYPRPITLERIAALTRGEVTANDFLRAREAAE